jgi:hypothetical protein
VKSPRAQKSGILSFWYHLVSLDTTCCDQPDESALHPDVKRLIGKRPQGRPSKAKVEQRNQQIAAVLTQLDLAEELGVKRLDIFVPGSRLHPSAHSRYHS